MKRSMVIATVLFSVLFMQASVANEECNYSWVLSNEDGSKTTPEQYAEKDRREAECKRNRADQQKRASNARLRLKKEFGVDSGGMPDNEAIARLQEEVNKRQEAEEAANERRAAAAEQRRMDQAESLLKKQDDMLKSLGVSMGSAGSAADEDDEDIDPVELQMYQKMVNSGVAPQCKGMQGGALIDCVDAAVEE